MTRYVAIDLKACTFPPPPPPPPGREFKSGIFGTRETKESIRAREDWEIYMKGYNHGLSIGRGNMK